MESVDIEKLLASDLSEGTEQFRERLLERCLSVIGQVENEGVELADEEIEMLAAAGEAFFDPDSDPSGLL